ncbi:hypothetical protein EV356DRAFT_564295 [Viridothelium virens]|uniref:SPT2-domain-containing protein n=1 Tax=Viridothelium virens TaxID=1048519 RepID=A0A6A6HKR3_VIRVR|nr:hypothetical protein EV356DRAFT_564295 [Viridothelium virens]
MSFLNQVLASIGSGSPSVPAQSPATRPRVPRPSAQADNNAAPAQETIATSTITQSGLKRKAENGNDDVQRKAAKTDLSSLGDRNTPKPRPAANVNSLSSRTPSFQGTAKSTTPKPANSNIAGSSASASTAPKSRYLATLEKAKAAQAAKSSVGIIKHKPIERLQKKDRLALKAEASGRKKPHAAKPAPSSKDTRNGVKSEDASKVRPKPAESGYKGTMRPSAAAPTAYKGTMRASASTPNLAKGRPSAPDKTRSKEKGRMAGYASYSEADSYDDEDDEELEEEEEEGGHGSDMSSDMEAGMDDVFDEEQLSLRVARKEDDEALKEENELRARKEARKRAALGTTGKRG